MARRAPESDEARCRRRGRSCPLVRQRASRGLGRGSGIGVKISAPASSVANWASGRYFRPESCPCGLFPGRVRVGSFPDRDFAGVSAQISGMRVIRPSGGQRASF
jgi:hypothetical protein